MTNPAILLITVEHSKKIYKHENYLNIDNTTLLVKSLTYATFPAKQCIINSSILKKHKFKSKIFNLFFEPFFV